MWSGGELHYRIFDGFRAKRVIWFGRLVYLAYWCLQPLKTMWKPAHFEVLLKLMVPQGQPSSCFFTNKDETVCIRPLALAPVAGLEQEDWRSHQTDFGWVLFEPCWWFGFGSSNKSGLKHVKTYMVPSCGLRPLCKRFCWEHHEVCLFVQ